MWLCRRAPQLLRGMARFSFVCAYAFMTLRAWTRYAQIIALEGSNMNMQTFNAMRSGAKAMQDARGRLDVDQVDDVMDDIKDEMDIAEQVRRCPRESAYGRRVRCYDIYFPLVSSFLWFVVCICSSPCVLSSLHSPPSSTIFSETLPVIRANFPLLLMSQRTACLSSLSRTLWYLHMRTCVDRRRDRAACGRSV